MKKPELYTIGYLLVLRCKIALRFLKELGWMRCLVVSFAISSLSLPIFEVLSDPDAALYLTVFDIAIISGIHFYRKDQHFIQSIRVRKRQLYVVEYLIISLPVLILLGYLWAWFWILMLIFTCVFMPTIPFYRKTGNYAKATLQLSLSLPFEWASGLRRQKWVLGVLLGVGLSLTWLHLFAGWIFVFFITATVMLFYRYCEPVSFVLLHSKNPASLLTKKIREGIGYYSLLTVLLWIEMMILYPGEIFYTGLFLLANLLLLITIIAAKYAFYRENMNIEMMIGTIFMYGCICLLVPYLPPALFLLLIWLIVRGHNRLKREVYAFH